MALEDVDLPNGMKISGEAYGINKNFKSAYWYYNAKGLMADYKTFTSENFGEGKNNTKKMVARWRANGTAEGSDANYRVGDEQDIWGQIGAPTNVNDIVWFVPSKAEWNAFGDALGITSANYFTKFKLALVYWSSSQFNDDDTWLAVLSIGCVDGNCVNIDYPVRLSATF